MAESLPLETLQHIFLYLPDNLTPCACVCRQWQVAAENFNFADLHINLADLEDFCQIVLSPNSTSRWGHVQSLHFKVVLPEYGVTARGHYENQDDCDSNNKVFTQAITSLFEILSSWPNYDRCEMELQVYARSPSDWRAEPDWSTRRARQQRGYAFPEEELLDRRYQDSYLQLTGKVSLPDVNCIKSFQVSGCDSVRNIAPGAVSEMVAHLPRLQTLQANLCEKERRDTAMCTSLEIQMDFSIISWPRSLRHLSLSFMPNRVHGKECSLLSNRDPDSLYLAMHPMTQHLETVHLSEITIGPELFWPADASNTPPFWPKLIEFSISCTHAAINTASHFGGTPRLDEDSSPISPDVAVEPLDDHDQQVTGFRRLLNKRLDELYLAAGRAAQHMPRLNSMIIDVGTFRVPTSLYLFRYDASSGIASWKTLVQFCVSKEVQTAWDVAAKGHGHGQICTQIISTYSVSTP
ncbi:hypothetical protein PITC_034010 [Penicillium italicum]|uniref:Uncharacterized protein n=1 Tax=Penicillium italicum TaxID=40296 RepID=A0A0A2LG67_PENIT|nr:hypothetical protein PITC_034010 [Penicillium italicum]